MNTSHKIKLFPAGGRLSYRARCRKAGFTLFELLVVMSIMLLIAAIAVPNISGLGQTAKYSQATSGVVDTFHLARQMAIVNNRAIEVRIFEMPAEIGDEAYFNSLGIVTLGNTELEIPDKAEGDLVRLPDGMVFDPEYSNMLSKPPLSQEGTGDGNLWRTTQDQPYVGFRYLADGTADLDRAAATGGGVFHLTIRELKDLKSEDTGLANFATIRLDPASGRATVYRPGVGGG